MNDFEMIILFAFRYCLGRMTYAPSTFIIYMLSTNMINNITDTTRKIMIQEIEECKNLGMDCDIKLWNDYKEKLKHALEK